MKVRLRTVLVLPFVLLTLLAITLVSLLSQHSGRRAVQQIAISLRSEIAERIEEHTLSFLSAPYLINRTNAFLLGNGLIDPADQMTLERYLLSQVVLFNNVTSIYFGNTEGGLVDAGREGAGGYLYVIATDDFVMGPFRKFATDSLGRRMELLMTVPDFDARTRSWYTDALQAGGEVWSEPFLLYTGQDMSISLNAPVYGVGDSLIGVLSSSIFLSHLDEFLKDLEIGATGSSFIMERSGGLIASSTGETLYTILDGDEAPERLSAFSSGTPTVSAAADFLRETYGGLDMISDRCWGEFTVDGGLQYILAQPITDDSGMDWVIVVTIPESDIMAPMQEGARKILVLTILIMGLTALFCVVIARLLTRPIIRLHRSTRTVTGDHSVLPRDESFIREIDELAVSFSDMITRLHQSMMKLVSEISERKAAEESLRKGEERLEMALQGTRAGTWDWNIPEGSIEVNDRWAEILGYSLEELLPISPETWRKLVHAEDMQESDRLLEAHIAGETDYYESAYRMRHKNGSWMWIVDRGRMTERDPDGKPLRIVGTHVDITARVDAEHARKELEERIRDTQKLESIGRLAGGVSHDLNNLLTPILGYGELLEENLQPEDPNRSSVEEIVRAAIRAKELVSQLLAFSRRQTLEFRVIDLNAVVLSFENLLKRTIRENIRIDLISSGSPVWVVGDAGQLEQVLMNLTLNAQDAMPEGGELTVRTGVTQLEKRDARIHGDTEPGIYGVLEITDTGAGMDEETMQKIFEPFFSTKGKLGTGLGMATVHGIVRQHHGGVSIASEPGTGTVISVYIPAGAEPCVETDPPLSRKKDLTGSETILLVEDEEQVRNITLTILGRLGYKVIPADSGEQALELLDRHEGVVHLVLTDVMLTGINGRDLWDRIREGRPGIRVLFMSGYTEAVVDGEGFQRECSAFIQKPFSITGIAARIRDVLDGDQAVP